LPPCHLNLDLAGRNRQRQSFFSAPGQAFFDRLINVPFRLHFRLSLADTTRDGGAFSDKPAIFILEYGDEQLQSSSPDFGWEFYFV